MQKPEPMFNGQSLMLKGHALAGYINAESGKRRGFSLVVDDVSVHDVDQNVVQVFQNHSSIVAMLWRSF